MDTSKSIYENKFKTGQIAVEVGEKCLSYLSVMGGDGPHHQPIICTTRGVDKDPASTSWPWEAGDVAALVNPRVNATFLCAFVNGI